MRSSNPVGIVNRGKSCYADSVIQMLFRIPVVRKIVANVDIYNERAANLSNNRNAKTIRQGLSVVEGLNHMFHQLQTNKTDSATFNYRKSMQCLPDKFAENKQEDADEYFTLVMASLMDILPASQHHQLFLRVSFNGTLTSTKDPLKTQPKRQTDFETRISLPFNGNGTLDDLLGIYFAPESVSLNFDDGTPGTLVRSKKLENLPKIVAIHLQRLSTDFETKLAPGQEPEIIRKNDIIVMPDELDLAKYANVKTNTKYRLKMFVVHNGDKKGGHYYAYALFNNNWCTLNDMDVTLNARPDLVKKDQNNGFLYFYERLN